MLMGIGNKKIKCITKSTKQTKLFNQQNQPY